jgi:hypothetical protein
MATFSAWACRRASDAGVSFARASSVLLSDVKLFLAMIFLREENMRYEKIDLLFTLKQNCEG